jgi:hypothetical protein
MQPTSATTHNNPYLLNLCWGAAGPSYFAHSLLSRLGCMQEGSEYHGTAARLKQVFEERYAKSIRDEG